MDKIALAFKENADERKENRFLVDLIDKGFEIFAHKLVPICKTTLRGNFTWGSYYVTTKDELIAARRVVSELEDEPKETKYFDSVTLSEIRFSDCSGIDTMKAYGQLPIEGDDLISLSYRITAEINDSERKAYVNITLKYVMHEHELPTKFTKNGCAFKDVTETRRKYVCDIKE